MSMRTNNAARAALAILALGVATRAAAGAGNGIRLGGNEGRLHPYLELEDRYDSNVFYTDTREPVGDMVLHVRPGFELAVPGELAAVELTGGLDWAQYLGVEDAQTTDGLSKLYGQAALGVSLNSRGNVGLEIDDEFRRAQGTTALVLSNAVISNYNALRVKVPWKPGGGALVASFNGAWLLETFESFFDQPICDPANNPLCDPTDDLGYNELRAGGEVRWRFLPRTSAVFQGGFFARAPNDKDIDSVSGLELQAGFTGLVTPHLGATIKAGYADTLGSAGDAFRTWLTTLEAEWIPMDSASVRAGFAHALGVDPGRAAVYTSSRLYCAGRILLAGRFALRADVNWERRAYDRVPVPVASPLPGQSAVTLESATADVLRIEPAFEAGVTRWMSASIGFAYNNRGSDFPSGAAAVPGLDFSKTETWVRVAVRY